MSICELSKCKRRAELILVVDDRELKICRKCWKKLIQLGEKWTDERNEVDLSSFIVIKSCT